MGTSKEIFLDSNTPNKNVQFNGHLVSMATYNNTHIAPVQLEIKCLLLQCGNKTCARLLYFKLEHEIPCSFST